MDAHVVKQDRWGDVIDRPALDLVEIRWHDTTRELTADGFRSWMADFADIVEQTGRARILTDATRFLMPREHMDGEWRDANVVPRYNAAGVRRFAFLFPSDLPGVGADPEVEGPAAYPTGYFDRREDALAWLADG